MCVAHTDEDLNAVDQYHAFKKGNQVISNQNFKSKFETNKVSVVLGVQIAALIHN